MSIFGVIGTKYYYRQYPFFNIFFFIPTVVFLFSHCLVLSLMRIDRKVYIPRFHLDLQGACMQHAETPRSETQSFE